MQSLWLEITNFFEKTLREIQLIDVIDVIIVAVVIYQLLKLTRKTRANQVLKGLVLVVLALSVSDLLMLQTLRWILAYILSAGAVVLVILFQPELRNALERMGRGANIDNILTLTEQAGDATRAVDEIVRAMINLSRRKVGALIVVEQKTGLNDVIATGTVLGAVISSALLENIFEPNTPLHDGATVIRGTRIAASGCFLTLTEGTELSRELGTRHRAAIGVTEGRDCVSLIVSEETGILSYARGGTLTRYLDEDSLRELLTPLFAANHPAEHKLTGIFKKKGGDGNEE